MPRVALNGGGYVSITDPLSPTIVLEVGHPEFGNTSVEIDGLDELDRVVRLVGDCEGDEVEDADDD